MTKKFMLIVMASGKTIHVRADRYEVDGRRTLLWDMTLNRVVAIAPADAVILVRGELYATPKKPADQ